MRIGSRDISPILLTGSHRSGTTWVGNVLAKAPELEILYEPFNLNRKAGKNAAVFPHWFTYICDENASKWEATLRKTYSFEYNFIDKMKDMPNYNGLKQAVYDTLQYRRFRSEGKTPLIKDPIAIMSAEWIVKTFDARVIVLIRHPAAFVSSLIRMNWTFDFKDFTEQPLLMRDHLGAFEEQIKIYAKKSPDLIDQAILLWNCIHHVIHQYSLNHHDWVFLRHEDLSLEPEQSFISLFNRMNLTLTDEVLAYIESTSHAEQKADVAAGVTHQLKRDSKQNITAWKQRLSDDEIAYILKGTQDIYPYFYSDRDW